MKKKTIQTNSLQCRALLDGNSFNKEDRTIEVVFATETPVRRYNWDIGEYMEILEISEKAIDFARMENGAPVLDSHARWSLNNIIGVVERAWVDKAKKEARALVRFSNREDLQPIVDDIEAGIIRNISVGYTVSEYTVENADKANQQYRATKWTPMEISFLPVPADHNSGARSEENTANNLTTIINSVLMENNNQQQRNDGENTTTSQATQSQEAAQQQQPAAPAAGESARAADPNTERTRVAAIMESCQRAGLGLDFASNLINSNVNVEAARAQIIDEVANQSNEAPTQRGAAVTGTDEVDQIREAAIQGMLVRAVSGSFDIRGNERAQRYANMRLIDVAKDRLRGIGQNFDTWSEQEIVKRAWTTTDFPQFLSNAFERMMRRAYESVVPEWQRFARQENATDFRKKTGLKFDAKAGFEEIPENGEYPTTAVVEEEAATVQLKKWGHIYSISDIAIINDDLRMFSKFPQIFGLDARNFQSKKVWDLIINNSKAPDGTAIFHSSHKNLAASGGALGEATLSAGRVAMRRQTSPTGKPLGIVPKFLIIPAELETAAQKLVTSIMATASGDVNVFQGKLEPVVIDWMTNPTAWHLAADPNAISADGLVYSYLNGQEGVQSESRVNFDTDSLDIKSKMFFDATIWGHQGWYKNPGA